MSEKTKISQGKLAGKKNWKTFKCTRPALTLLMLLLATAVVLSGFYALPGFSDAAYAAETFDDLAAQAAVNSYAVYIDGNGNISPSSYSDLDPYAVYILAQAGVAVDTWSCGEEQLTNSVLDMIETSLNNEADEDSGNDVNAKYIAYQYLAACSLGEDYLAQDLLEILINRHSADGDGTFLNGEWSQWTNLPVFDALSRTDAISEIDQSNREKSIDYILSLQSGGSFSDFMSTAEAVRSLTALQNCTSGYRTGDIEIAITDSLSWMRNKIQEDGSLVDGSWDDPVMDTAEAIVTLKYLGEDPAEWSHDDTGKSPLDYMLETARNPNGSFGIGNQGANTWALDAFIFLDAAVADDTALALSIAPEDIELFIGEEQAFTATAFLSGGTEEDVSGQAQWSVDDPEKAGINAEGGSILVTRTASGNFCLTADYQLVSGSVVVGTSETPGYISVTIRIEGPDYTILPDTIVNVPPGSSYTQVLLAGQAENGYTVEESGGFVNTINGLGAPEFYWMAAPYQAEYNDGDSFVMSGNGSTVLGEISLPDPVAAAAGSQFAVGVTTEAGQPVAGAKVIYYQAENMTAPIAAGITDENGQLTFSIARSGHYYIAADKANTGIWPEPDNGLVRTEAGEMAISSGSGGGGSDQGIPVDVEVTGKSGETLYDRDTVSLENSDEHGITPVGALDKTGLSYDYDSIEYIHTIDGQGPQGMSGWMYKVNGVSPETPAIDYIVDSGDYVLWFFSSETDDIAVEPEGSELGPEQNSISLDEFIEEFPLAPGRELKINLEKTDSNGVEITPETVQKLYDNRNGITLASTGIQICFTHEALYTKQLQQAIGQDDTVLLIGVREVSGTEKQEILDKAENGKPCGLIQIGGKIFDLTAQLVQENSSGENQIEAFSNFAEPVKVSIALSAAELSQEEISKLTAVRYEKDGEGNSVPVKLGGTYDPVGQTFTFYTERFSFYGVARAEKLVNIIMGLNFATTVNGKETYSDVPLTLINNRTMVPVRFVSENFGAYVQWLPKEKTVEIKLDDQVLSLVIDRLSPGLDTPATIVNGRTMVPIRYVAESMGARVTWHPSARRVEIVR